MDDLDLDNPAWRFAVTLYARPGVGAECLRLQDERGLDVSLLLVCLWLGAERRIALDETGLAAAKKVVDGWLATAVRPLREIRRTAKASPLISEPEVQAWRDTVKKAELDAERIEIALLHRWAEKLGGASPLPAPARPAALHNLRLVLGSDDFDRIKAPALSEALAVWGLPHE